MNSLIKKIIITVMFITIILTGITTVNAATTTISLSSNDKIVAGGTITININVSSPVYGISAKISYDKDVFESATVASSVATSANLANNTIVIDSETAMPAGTIGTITLKVKSTISKNEAVVSLSNVKATDESLNTQTLNSPNITLKTNANSTPNNGSDQTQNNGSDQTQNNGSEQTSNNNNGNSGNNGTSTVNANDQQQGKVTTAKKANISQLPKAGLETGIVFVLVAGLLVGIVFYAKYKNIKKYDK